MRPISMRKTAKKEWEIVTQKRDSTVGQLAGDKKYVLSFIEYGQGFINRVSHALKKRKAADKSVFLGAGKSGHLSSYVLPL